MRINKEIASLSKFYRVIFIGIGYESHCFVKEQCKEVFLIKGERNSLPAILKLIWIFLKILFTRKVSSIHVINEQLMVFFYPFLFFKYTVLDLFDSVFLRWNKAGNQWLLFKWIIYLPVDKILVTDENRRNLMPDYLQKKCTILPNYPYNFIDEIKKERDEMLRILFNGWMGLHRGTEIAEGLLKTGLPLRIIMAGWFSDDYTRNLVAKYPDKINYLGVLPQSDTHKIAARTIDYILCVYDPINENNINASPNKIYDAIQTMTPLIINAEVKASSFVKEHHSGVIIPEYQVDDFHALHNLLIEKRGTFIFNENLKKKYSWESIEHILLQGHSH